MNNILINYQKKLVNAVEKGWDGSDSSDIRKWTFASAFLYSLTVITTIGKPSIFILNHQISHLNLL